jgi:hypothetical protein
VAETGADSFVESLMDTNLYSIGAYFHDRHPDLVDSVVRPLLPGGERLE